MCLQSKKKKKKRICSKYVTKLIKFEEFANTHTHTHTHFK